MDGTDYAIYRYLSRDGFVRFWGARRQVDPRPSAREIAERVGLSEAGARIRLRGLERHGFLRAFEVGVNPALFGASLVMSEIPVRDPGDAARLLRELALADGVTFARDVLDEGNRAIRVSYVADTPTATARRTALLRRLAGVAELRGPTPYWLPPCSKGPSPLDWRVLKAVRELPQAPPTELAKAVGVSVKTTSIRLRGLIAARACWWSVGGASEEPPLAMVAVALDERSDRSRVGRTVTAAMPVWMPVAVDGYGRDPAEPGGPLLGLVPAESPAALERVLGKVSGLEGVRGVRRTFGLGSASYPDWTSEQLAARVAARA